MQGIGAAVEKAVNICLEAQSKYAGISLEVHTFTMPLVDDLMEDDEVADGI